jgi:hypothetical protein
VQIGADGRPVFNNALTAPAALHNQISAAQTTNLDSDAWRLSGRDKVALFMSKQQSGPALVDLLNRAEDALQKAPAAGKPLYQSMVNALHQEILLTNNLGTAAETGVLPHTSANPMLSRQAVVKAIATRMESRKNAFAHLNRAIRAVRHPSGFRQNVSRGVRTGVVTSGVTWGLGQLFQALNIGEP